MRIVIDLQGAQTESRFRGIGRYTLSLAQAIVRNRGEHEIILALSGLFPDTIEPIRAAFVGLLPQENIRVWHAPGPIRECEADNKWRREVAERIREAFLANLGGDVIFIPSFFDGYQDDCVISIGVFAPNLKTVIAIDRLDEVPTYDANLSQRSYVLNRLENLKRANLLVVFSPLMADEVSQCLGVPHDRVRSGFAIGEAGVDLSDATTAACDLFKILEEITATPPQEIPLPLNPRPKLAYVSPLPPERTGIADYSAELLPELACFYDIDVIVDQAEIAFPWGTANCGMRTVDWFVKNSHHYDRVLYHFGNSNYHQHMFGLLAHVPGVVVLHDFYLGDVQYYLETHGILPNAWTRALYESHGYAAVVECRANDNIEEAVRKFPVNLGVLTQAKGVIVHSYYSMQLANEWYGRQLTGGWSVIPLLRSPSYACSRSEARKKLGLKSSDFVVCSFGLLGSTKLNHRLLEAWLNSILAHDACCFLIFVGADHNSEYGTKLRRTIHASGLDKRIRITGWTDMQTYRHYLAAADIAVQLRTQSRGETSAAVLDTMNYALPTIANAHGSMAEMPSDALWVLPDKFENHQLTEALESLWKNDEQRSALSKRAKEVILNLHAPRACASQYVEAVERFHVCAQSDTKALIKSIADVEGYCPTDAECLGLAQFIGNSLPSATASKQLLVDVSATCRNDLKTGIQRVVRSLVQELVLAPPHGYRVEPVYLTDEGGVWHYRYARDWTLRSLGIIDVALPDDPAEYFSGDLMLIADFTLRYAVETERAGVYEKLKINGIALHFIVYDLLPIQMPEVFPRGSFGYVEWLQAISRVADSAICISQAVAAELRAWADVSSLPRTHPIKIGWFHLGADIESSVPTRGLPSDSDRVLARVSAAPSFLMVGTIEPRKGYLQVLDAFSNLWKQGVDINLVIVGNEGWKGLPDAMRRTIPEIVERLRTHPELGKRLFWLNGASDEYLEKLYAASVCLISASEGEGFGLPLIEAAQHKLPILARDIPVFREVAGEYACYFRASNGAELANAVKNWLALYAEKRIPLSDEMPFLTWKQSAERLMAVILSQDRNEKSIGAYKGKSAC